MRRAVLKAENHAPAASSFNASRGACSPRLRRVSVAGISTLAIAIVNPDEHQMAEEPDLGGSPLLGPRNFRSAERLSIAL